MSNLAGNRFALRRGKSLVKTANVEEEDKKTGERNSFHFAKRPPFERQMEINHRKERKVFKLNTGKKGRRPFTRFSAVYEIFVSRHCNFRLSFVFIFHPILPFSHPEFFLPAAVGWKPATVARFQPGRPKTNRNCRRSAKKIISNVSAKPEIRQNFAPFFPGTFRRRRFEKIF